MSDDDTRLSGRVGSWTAATVAALLGLYAVTLAVGLLSLERPEDPIPDPWFTAMEALILMLMPAIVVMAVAACDRACPRRKTAALAAVAFASMLATITMAVHFLVLTIGRAAEFSGLELVFGFRWPSVVYALDILAWDIFFPLFAASLAFAFENVAIRRLLLLSATLAFAGLAGAITGDMALRNIGIVGYVIVFFPATVLIAVHMGRPGTPR